MLNLEQESGCGSGCGSRCERQSEPIRTLAHPLSSALSKFLTFDSNSTSDRSLSDVLKTTNNEINSKKTRTYGTVEFYSNSVLKISLSLQFSISYVVSLS